MVSDPFLMGVFYGFVPAMGFLYILLHTYEAFFNEKRLFLTFFVGIVFGVVITALTQTLGPKVVLVATAADPSLFQLGELLVFAALIAVLETAAFTAVLNWRTFRGRRDTPFFGTAFGLGFGAANVIFLLGGILRALELQGATADLYEVLLLSIFSLYFIGSILAFAAMGAWVGRGTASGDLWPEFARASLLRTTFNALFYAILVSSLHAPLFSNLLPVLGIIVGVLVIRHVIRFVLDRVVPPEVLREMEIHKRRLARAVVRETEEKTR